MTTHPLAGKKAPASMLVNVPELVSSYYTNEPKGPVAFGTSGHRGSSFDGTFNEHHIAAVGLRGYLAHRILLQNGFKSKNLSGGYRTYSAVVK